MTTLSVWKFDSVDGAVAAIPALRRLAEQHSVPLQDVGVITWPSDARKPGITQLESLVGPGALGGAFHGALFSLVFLVPALSPAMWIGLGELVASPGDIGLDERLIKQVRDKLTRGTSGLVLLTASAVTDVVLDEMQAQPGHADLIEANLTREQESKLRRTFGVQAAEPPPTIRRAVA